MVTLYLKNIHTPYNDECTASSPPDLASQNSFSILLHPSVHQEFDCCGLCHLGFLTTWLLVGLPNEQQQEGERGWGFFPTPSLLECCALTAAASSWDYCSLLAPPSPQL